MLNGVKMGNLSLSSDLSPPPPSSSAWEFSDAILKVQIFINVWWRCQKKENFCVLYFFMADIIRSTYFDLEEERSRGWSDSSSSSIWEAGWGSNRETDLKLEERPVAEAGFSCSLSNFVSSSRHSMLYSPLVDSPRCPFQIFAIFWKYTDHKFINYLGKIIKEMLKKSAFDFAWPSFR